MYKYYYDPEQKALGMFSEYDKNIILTDNNIVISEELYNEAISKIDTHEIKIENNELIFIKKVISFEEIFNKNILLISQKIQIYSDTEVIKLLNYASQVEINTWVFKLEAANKILNNIELSESENLFFKYANYDTIDKKIEWSKKVIYNSKVTSVIYGIHEYFRNLTKIFINSISVQSIINFIIANKKASKESDITQELFESELKIILDNEVKEMQDEANIKLNELQQLILNIKK